MNPVLHTHTQRLVIDLFLIRYRLQQEICDYETLSINKQRQHMHDAMATR